MTGDVNKPGTSPKKTGGNKLVPIILLIVIICLGCLCFANIPQLFNSILKPEPTIISLKISSPTNSPTVTLTPMDTMTNTPTFTPTETATLEPPATLTAISKNGTKTEISKNITSTANKIYSGKTATAFSRASTATEIAKYNMIDWRELVDYPGSHIGEFIKIHGQVFNIASNQEFQMFVGNYEGIYVYTKDPFSGLYQDMWVWVYGVAANTYCFTNTFGTEICQPFIDQAFWSVNPL
jgi:hypothetical protein